MSKLKFSHGTMNCGKSTLALQMDFNMQQAGKKGRLFTRLDRGGSVISSRLGLEKTAQCVELTDNFCDLIGDEPLDYIIVDEVQFLNPEQIDQLGQIVDEKGIDVFCYGISSDFTSSLFAGSRRLFEIADVCEEMQLKALCWCGADGRVNARVVDGKLARTGEQVVVGDNNEEAQVHYTLLCRRHFREGKINAS